MPDRLFVPLSSAPFDDFMHRGKKYELRACERCFAAKFVYEGRPVELRKGYSGESMWGQVGNVVAGSLEEIFNQIDYILIEPTSITRESAINDNLSLLGPKQKYIAFQVILNDKP